MDEKNEVIIPFESDYQYIKEDHNYMWFKYEERIQKVINGLSYWKNFDKYELMQQAYIYFVEFCKIYDPYYMGNFYPFDKFIFKNLIMKLRAYIQRYYFKNKREEVQDVYSLQNPTTFKGATLESIEDIETKELQKELFKYLKPIDAIILKENMKGTKQNDIAIKVGISQSRVSVRLRQTKKILQRVLNENFDVKKEDNIKMKKQMSEYSIQQRLKRKNG